MIKVSLIVPIYNSEKYLTKCLDSLVNQTFKDLEIILINDGSTDSSKTIIEEYAKKFNNIVVINNPNYGIGKSRNIGIEKAKGKYIGFVDSDDYIDEKMVQMCYNRCEKDNLDVVVFDYYIINNQKKDIFKIKSFLNTTLDKNTKLLFQINMSPWNKLYKKSLFDENIFFPENLKYEDFLVLPKLLLKSQNIGKLNLPLYYYIIRNNSETTTMDKRVFDIFDILNLINANFINKKEYYYELEYLNIEKLMNYNIGQRYQQDMELRNKFINKTFEFLNQNFKHWKNNKYYKNRNIFKRLIETNKNISKIYCSVYNKLRK